MSGEDRREPPRLPEGKETLFLVDGPSQMFRAFYAIRGLSTRDGFPTGAVYGFVSMMRKVLREFRPEHAAVAFDTAAPTFRHDAYEHYKANREEMPDDLSLQVPKVLEACDVLRIPVLAREGWEADDIIATLARKAAAQGIHTVIVTQDKDLFQLVDEDTWILYASRGEDVLLDPAGVVEKFGVRPDQVADVLSLMGDSVDNIPGVPGIGEKGAKALISEFGSLDALLEDPARVERRGTLRGAGRYARLLEEHAELARRTRELVHLERDAPVEIDLEAFRLAEPDPRTAFRFFKEMEFTRLLDEFSEPMQEARVDYACITDEARLEEFLAGARSAGVVGVDTETTSKDPVRAELVGFSLAVGPGDACYVPLRHRYAGCPPQVGRDRALAGLRGLLEDPKVLKVGQNLKYDRIVLERAGVGFEGHEADTMVAAYLLDPTRGTYKLDSLANEFLKYRCISYEDVCGKGKHERPFFEVDLASATRYAAEDADIALRLWSVLEPELRAQGLAPLFEQVEMPLVPILAGMEEAGIRVNVKHLEDMSRRLERELADLQRRIFGEAGVEFNLNSPRQLAEVLFERLRLPVLRKTQKTRQASTSEAVLSRLAASYEIPRLILDYRELQKLKSTYVDALPGLVNPETGRIHPSYNQTVTATGRLSSSDPNIQNIPIRTEIGREVRMAFVPEEGWRFLSADYSQVELRVLAHLARDPKLIETFRRGEDIHTRTASEVFGVAPEEVTSAQRARAKAVNFGVLYGMGPGGLSQQIGVSYGEAKAFIERYFDRYPAVRDYIERTLEELRRTGRVTTLFNRVRSFPDVVGARGRQRSFAERAAINTTIQGTAADLMKMAMIRVCADIERERLRSRMIMQIHDELVFEAPEEEVGLLEPLVRRAMEQVHELEAPLVVRVSVGVSWYEV